MLDANFWSLFREAAQQAGCTAESLVNLDRPDAGIQAASNSAGGSEFRLLSISPSDGGQDWPAKLVDSYSRGDDVVASYAGTAGWPFAPQIYWTAESDVADHTPLHSLSLVVSIQTDRLDTHPRIFVRSSVPAEEILLVSVVSDNMLVDSHVEGVQSLDSRASGYGLVWRLPKNDLSYAEIMPTSDFRKLAIERADDTIESRWELFAEFLEKGVIRRSRLQAMFVPRENDVQLVAECCQNIERRTLPLTT